MSRVHSNHTPARVLIVQRVSLSHATLRSRSVAARFGPLLDYMQRSGLIVWNEMLESDIKPKDLKDYQAILLNKHTSSKGLDIIKAAKDLEVHSIYDLDDWILDLPSYSVTNLDEDVLSNIVQMIRLADTLTVSNTVLQGKLKYLRDDALILPNSFDHDAMWIDPQHYQEATPPRILFSNTDGIKLVTYKTAFIQQLVEFMEQFPQVTLDFWGDHFPELGRIPRVCERGFTPNKSYKKSIKDQGYLFAVVPLGGQEDPDTFFFNSCKSCIKYIDYGSLGIPGIYSDSPVYARAIKHGKTGLVIKNTADNWLQAMISLYHDGHLRQRMRLEAHSDCIANYGVQKVAKEFSSVIQR